MIFVVETACVYILVYVANECVPGPPLLESFFYFVCNVMMLVFLLVVVKQ